MKPKRYKSKELLRLYQSGERDFRKARLAYQSFKGQDLSGIDLEGADIQGADFTNAILRGANFRSVINPGFKKTSFRNADLIDADCTLATFERTDFEGAIFNRECWQQAKKVGRVRHPSFSQSDLRHRRPKWLGGTIAHFLMPTCLINGILLWLMSIYYFLSTAEPGILSIALVLLLGVIGLYCFWQAWRINQRNQGLKYNGQLTPGKITDLWFVSDDENRKDFYFVAYQFAEGFQAYQVFHSGFGSASEGLLPTKLHIGDRVIVRYVVTNPEFSRIEEWK
ncbi:MAG: pentapeptide repeat-containing protein [Cyanobacteriota bacterium]